MINFKEIEYLKSGNSRQQEAYKDLKELGIFEKLKNYNPVLTGTIPIEIDLPASDLDIICSCKNHREFSKLLSELFKNQNEFKIHSKTYNGRQSTIAKFKTEKFEIEIFGQNKPTEQQNAYRHMLIEYQILKAKGKAFQSEIIKLKEQGIKTEPAFAKLLELEGNPYEKLLNLKKGVN